MMGDWATAEDAAQEAFLSGYRAIRTFWGENLRAWLMRIVANTCRDMLRARKSRPSICLDYPLLNAEEGEGPPLDPPSPDESPEEYALRRELGRAIQEGLQFLPEDRRLVITVVDIQGYSYEEAASIMDCSVGTVKSRLSRGRGGLPDYLQRYQELLPSQFRLDS